MIQSVKLTGELQTPGLTCADACSSNAKKLTTGEVCISLSPPAGQKQLQSGGCVGNWMRGDFTPLADLFVEFKAVRAAMECLREWLWTGKPMGNVLLEGAIPRLQQALDALNGERAKQSRSTAPPASC